MILDTRHITPADRALLRDEATEQLIAQQEAATGAWQKFVALMIPQAQRLLEDMPLGSCVPGYDKEHIVSLMEDWMHVRPIEDDDWREAGEIVEARGIV